MSRRDRFELIRLSSLYKQLLNYTIPQLLNPYKFPFFASSSKYSDARHDSAIMVSVGFLSGLLTNDAASVTNRFFTSCAWQYPFNAEVFGFFPMRTTPSSWMFTPPSAMP